MIGINDLYLRMQDLSRKNQGGYISTDEYNRNIATIQRVIFDYYLEISWNQKIIHRNIQNFVRESTLPNIEGSRYYDLPSDYDIAWEVGFEYTANGKTEVRSSRELTAGESLMTQESSIRSASLVDKRFQHEIINNQVKAFPADQSGRCYLKYLISPPSATRAFTLVSDEEVYDSASSVDLVWNSSEEPNFIDLLLLYKGIQIRETALIQWVQVKNSFIPKKLMQE